jgi:branched-chain amino acid transport system ATP-binding protein
VAHVPEGRGVLPGLTVRENLKLALPSEDDRERALEVFPRLGERLGQRAGTMSGGEQQMLAVAAALATDLRLLLVDEVSLGLAPIIVDELYAVLTEVRRSGVTIVLVEQFADRALSLADHVVVLVKGRAAFAGGSQALQGSPDLLRSLYLGGSA